MQDKKLARRSFNEEKKAVKDYTKRKGEVKSKGLKKTITHALGEEKQHARAFSKYK